MEVEFTMYGYVYRTSFDNGRYKYIGQKKSSVFLGEKYLGSGADYFQKVKNKYKDTATVELLEECNSKEQLNEQEKYWISYYNAVEDHSYLNIHEGGNGGNTRAGYTEDEFNNYCKKMSEIKTGCHHIMLQSTRDKISNALKGKPKSEEHREKIKLINIGRKHSKEFIENHRKIMSGSNNPCYGKICITDGTNNKFIYPNELDNYMSNGWRRGMRQTHKDNTGSNHPRYNKRYKYMNNGIINRMIKYEEVDKYLNDGWIFGMIRKSK